MKFITLILFVFLLSSTKAQSKQQYTKDTSYVLKGKLEDFNLLYLALKTSRDITPNQSDYLDKFMHSLKPQIDSVKVSK